MDAFADPRLVDFDEQRRAAIAAAMGAAAASGGVVCRGSAALVHGWELVRLPPRPQVTVRKNKDTARLRSLGVEFRKLNLPPHHVEDGVTTRARSLVDCLRYYPVSHGLAVADSALRAGFSRDDLDELARSARGPNAHKVKMVARVADPRSESVFESLTRAVCMTVPGLDVVPQVSLGSGMEFLGRPDLVDLALGMIIESDSAEHHATVDGINRDSRRYDEFVVQGWLVLRFTWAQVVRDPAWVRSILVAAVARRRAELGLPPAGDVRTAWGLRELWVA